MPPDAMMTDREGVEFLQWCLPQLGLRWRGFRRVRRQVCTRVGERLQRLGVPDASAYRAYLEIHPDEWRVLDALCRIPISRFYRDRAVFAYLEGEVLPALGRLAAARGDDCLHCWSIGCAGGEEPYTLTILWALAVARHFPALRLLIVATDVEPRALERAAVGEYPGSSVKDLPVTWRAEAFIPSGKGFRLKPEYRQGTRFLEGDVRLTAPDELFDLVLCRYLAFTYFSDDVQRAVLERIKGTLRPGGALVIGASESLPRDTSGLEPWSERLRVYRRTEAAGPVNVKRGGGAAPPAQARISSAHPDHAGRPQRPS